jgi:hypothetical protein
MFKISLKYMKNAKSFIKKVSFAINDDMYYNIYMTNIDKFYSDVQKIKKKERSENPIYDGRKASLAVASMFESMNRDLGDLPHSISEYWMNNYIDNSSEVENEPTDEHVEWLLTVLSFLDGSLEPNMDLPKKDWKALMDFINYEAESLPINVLTDLMAVLVSKKVL